MRNRIPPLLSLMALSLLLPLLAACGPPAPPDDPNSVSSILIVDNRGFPGLNILVNGEPAIWDSSGRAVYESPGGIDYTVEAFNAPEGRTLEGFWIGLESLPIIGGEYIGELVRANPLRLHVEKTSLIVWPVYDSDQARLSAMPGSARLPEGIVLP